VLGAAIGHRQPGPQHKGRFWQPPPSIEGAPPERVIDPPAQFPDSEAARGRELEFGLLLAAGAQDRGQGDDQDENPRRPCPSKPFPGRLFPFHHSLLSWPVPLTTRLICHRQSDNKEEARTFEAHRL
jgi:hypothetical protein